MLYDRWREIALQFANERALTNAGSGETWTFAQLARAAERLEPTSKTVFPQGNSPKFVFEVLRGWRAGSIVCPLEPGQAVPLLIDIAPNIRHIKLTSGTTSAPRAILFTEEQIAADAQNIIATMGLKTDAPNLTFISLAHSYGFSNLITPLLLHGIPLIIGGHPLPEVLKGASRLADRVTLPAVPALWRGWANANSIPKNIALAISAGAPLSISLESEILMRHGLKIHNFYGASECGGIAFDRATSARTDGSLTGSALQGVSVSIGEDGCLRVQSLAAGTSYWPAADRRLSNGFFQTSDLVEIRDGGICMRGRAGEQLNLAGRKIQPEAIEEIVLQHPAVRQCVVFGIPNSDGERAEIAIAAVVADGKLSQRDLNTFLLDRIPGWQVPRRWWFVESLNENGRGKISRRDLRERYLLQHTP